VNETVVANGVSVINGAQTTGVLGNAPRELAAACRVPCRLIKCGNADVVNEIIENNNTQNAIKAFDIRSNDVVQRRLQTEFAAVQIHYLHRRQGAQRLSASAIQAEAFAPSWRLSTENSKLPSDKEEPYLRIVQRMVTSSRHRFQRHTCSWFIHCRLR